MTFMTGPVRTLDQVEQDLRRRMEEIGRHQAEVLRLIREADAMQAHSADGARTMADWTAARLDVSTETARVLVSTARGIESVPVLEEALAKGRVSFDRTVELVRAVTLRIDISDHCEYDIGGLRRLISKRRGRTCEDDHDAFDARYLVLQPSLDKSRWRFHGRLDGPDGALVEAALDQKADEMTEGVPGRPALAQRRCDALVAFCGGESVRTEVVIFVDAEGATVNGLIPVGRAVVDEAECSGRVGALDVTDPRLRSKRHATIPTNLRRAVLHRDGGMCTIDGCSSRYRIQAHDIIPRAESGTDHPDNLVSLCWFHHHVVVHRHGRRIDPASPPFRRRFLRGSGRSPPG